MYNSVGPPCSAARKDGTGIIEIVQAGNPPQNAGKAKDDSIPGFWSSETSFIGNQSGRRTGRLSSLKEEEKEEEEMM